MRIATALVAVLLAGLVSAPGEGASAPCTSPPNAGYTARVMRALAAKQDVWGNELLAARGGPTYERALGYLAPLFYARARGKTALTRSGAHYLALGVPGGAAGTSAVMLHVADGSEIVADRIGGTSISVRVAGEAYGSCLARLKGPALADGWLPVLQTRYTGNDGTRYEQESFAARAGGAATSFVRVSASRPRRIAVGSVSATTRELFVMWRGRRPLVVTEDVYDGARAALRSYWNGRVAEAATIETPEAQVNFAFKNLLVQSLTQTWRYSLGNPYEQFSFPEGLDVAQIMAELGHAAVSRAIIRTSLTRRPTPYANWKMGEKLVAAAAHDRVLGDPSFVRAVTPALRRYVDALGRQLPRNGPGLLDRERYSSDIPDQVYGLHGQAVVWQGLRGVAEAWSRAGQPALARRARGYAAQLEAGLRSAVRRSQRGLPDGSLFVPVRLLDDERPYASLTESRPASYWNLVMPYALASGLFAPGSPEAEGVFRYMLRHGSRLLGLVRAGAFSLYRSPVHPVSGTDAVYNINVARFLADNDEADQLVLSLYGLLAAGMTPNTFVSGEAASVAPLPGDRRRAMYLPPNGATNAAFLVTLRLALVHETATELRLAHSTPRAWLTPGKRVTVKDVPTRFGPVSYELRASSGSVRVTAEIPARATNTRLRIRLPNGTDRTVRLRPGHVDLVVRTVR